MFGNHQITPTLGKFLFSSEFFSCTQVSLAITTATNTSHWKKTNLDEQQMANSKITTGTLMLVAITERPKQKATRRHVQRRFWLWLDGDFLRFQVCFLPTNSGPSQQQLKSNRQQAKQVTANEQHNECGKRKQQKWGRKQSKGKKIS